MKAFALVFLLSLAASAEPDKYTFVTTPPGAKIFVHMLNPGPGPDNHNVGLQSAAPSFVGTAGIPIQMDLRPFRDEAGKLRNLQITFELPGHQSTTVEMNQDLLNRKRFPAVGSLHLEPDNSLVALQDFVVGHPLATATALLLTLLPPVLLAQKGTLKKQKARVEEQQKLVLGDLADPYMGKKLGDYFIVDKLGEGGMAKVYRAVPAGTLDSSQSVALKVIAAGAEDEQEFRQRFLREVKAYLDLSHPNIVRLIEWEASDPMYLVMERIEGPTLRQHLRGQLSVVDTVGFLYPMVAAVAFAHSKGIVHRDLKPENVMLQKGNIIKVMDFGLARSQEVSRKLTMSGTALGTPAYMAPEQIAGATAPSADQYALGVMTYEMLAGRLPFEGDVMTMLFAHMSLDVPPLREFRQGLPEAMEALVMKMLAREPGDRFASLEDVRAELERMYPRLKQQ